MIKQAIRLCFLGAVPRHVKGGGQHIIIGELCNQLFNTDSGIFDQRFHRIDILQRGIEIYRIVDPEYGFTDFITAPCCPANHLLIEDAGLHAPQKHQMRDRRDINPGGQKVNRNGNTRITFIFKAFNQFTHLITFTDFLYRGLIKIRMDIAHRSIQ